MLMLVRGSDCLRLGAFAGEWGFDVLAGFWGGLWRIIGLNGFFWPARGGGRSLWWCVVLEMWESWFRMRSLLY